MGKKLHRWIRWLAMFAKWFLVVIGVLMVMDWIVSHVVARKNQQKIDRFYTSVQADSLEEFAGRKGSDDITGNGWYFYLCALSLISKETRAATMMDDDGEELSNEVIILREAELDRIHEIIEEAKKAPYIFAVVDYCNPLAMDRGPIPQTYAYVCLAAASARDTFREGRPEKAVERIVDAIRMVQVLTSIPLVTSANLAAASYDRLLVEMVPMLQDLPDSAIDRLEKEMEVVDLYGQLASGFKGEMYYDLASWESVAPGRIWLADRLRKIPWLNLSLGSSILELDKSVYLDLKIPLALEPTLENARRFSKENLPFYAMITRVMCPNFMPWITRNRHIRGKMAVYQEALRLERVRREKGEWPEPRSDYDGIPLEIKRIEDGLEITSPIFLEHRPEWEEIFVVKLR